jgi:hypothetical protein
VQIVARDKEGLGIMIFPNNVFKYNSSMLEHIPSLAAGNSA